MEIELKRQNIFKQDQKLGSNCNLSNKKCLKRIKKKILVNLAEELLSEVLDRRELESNKYLNERLNEENIKCTTLCRSLDHEIKTLKEVVRLFQKDLRCTKDFLWPRKVKRPISIQLNPYNLNKDEVEKNIKNFNLKIIYPSQHILNSLTTDAFENKKSDAFVSMPSDLNSHEEEVSVLQNSPLSIGIDNNANNNLTQVSTIALENKENLQLSNPSAYNIEGLPCDPGYNVIKDECNILKDVKLDVSSPEFPKESFKSKPPLTHPPPLPEICNDSYAASGFNSLPSQPQLKVKPSKDGNNIIVSWNLTCSQDRDEVISFYELYGYKEVSNINGYKWRQIGGNVNAVPLPMAVTLSQFKHGFNYHFCVCAVDSMGRKSEFSEPRCLKF